MRDTARRLEGSDDDAARGSLIANARGYVALLREHIIKEDEMLFPLADKLGEEAKALRHADNG